MKRASGTFWERQLVSNWTTIAILTCFIGYGTGEWLGTFIVLSLFPGIVLVLIDLFTFSRFNLRSVHCAERIHIGEGQIGPDEVVSIRLIELKAVKNSWNFCEIQYRSNGFDVNALCLAKPHWLLFGTNPTIRILLEHFPQLKPKVLDEYTAYSYKEVRDPSARRPDPPPVEYAEPSPTARYRDPYFQRHSGRSVAKR